jgi:hypothetical protein
MRFQFTGLAIALLTTALFSGSAEAAGIIGARAGVSVAEASLDVDATFSEENRTGFAGSLFAQLGLGVIMLQPEVSYIQKGISGLELNYVEFAGLAKAGLPIPVVTPHLFAGIGADILTNSETDFNIDTKNTDWTAIFGADVMFNLSGFIAVVDGRYGMGLTEIEEASDTVSNLKNRAWLFSAGLAKSF